MTERILSPTDPFLCTEEFDLANLAYLHTTFKKSINPANGYISLTRVNTALGTMLAGATEKGICLFEFADCKKVEMELRQLSLLFKRPFIESEHPHFNTLREQIDGYFKGDLQEFSLPLDLVGTEFQVHTWCGLANIPYGTTTTYAKQAESLGIPSAVRAVANANGKNRISIILPCHRIVGTNGTLTGYGGGLWRKKKLLEWEQRVLRK